MEQNDNPVEVEDIEPTIIDNPSIILEDAECYVSDLLDNLKVEEYPEDLFNVIVKPVEGKLVERVLREVDFNQTQASRVLNINRGTLRKKLTEHKIELPIKLPKVISKVQSEPNFKQVYQLTELAPVKTEEPVVVANPCETDVDKELVDYYSNLED